MSAELDCSDAELWRLRGDLTFGTVSGIEASLPEFSGLQNICLAQAGRVDSAGLALLLEWYRSAKAHGASLALRNIPAQLLALIQTAGLTDILVHETPGDPLANPVSPDLQS